jgi:hypothetical protein
MRKNQRQLHDCDRCGFTHRKHLLKKQRGMLLCSACFDTVLEIPPVNIPWGSSRENATSLTAVNTPTVYSITNAGILFLGQSYDNERDGVHKDSHMQVVGSGGAVAVVNNPQIVAATNGTILTLEGTDDTNTVTFHDGDGLSLASGQSVVLSDGVSITLVFNSTASTWVEASRS